MSGAKVNVTVNGEPYMMRTPQPVTIWLDEGESATISAPEAIPAFIGSYVLDYIQDEHGNPVEDQITADKPRTVTAVYRQSFGCLI
ncbi:MAG: hypothetical protein GTN80_04850, partial [Nitrososphaeria archaeon]|nr:hypothetical protein [Nitrososphaeria archaeon]